MGIKTLLWIIIAILWIGIGAIILKVEIESETLECLIRNKPRPKSMLISRLTAILMWPIAPFLS